MTTYKVVCTFGTRPEAIKMAPVVRELQARGSHIEPLTVVTGQHREMLHQVLARFGIVPDVDLDIMQPGQSLTDVTTRCLTGLEPVYRDLQPAMVLVHGDTTTTLGAALAAFYQKIPVGHVEAGLRTFDVYQPFPEEMNRLITDRLATLHFAPTRSNQEHLLREGVPQDGLFVTGNTAIDALLSLVDPHYTFEADVLRAEPWKGYQLVLCDVHRRENFGAPLQRVVDALKQLVEKYPQMYLVVSVHPNPEVQSVIHRTLEGVPRVQLVEPLDYADWANLMGRARFIVTDSGGLQEEAPALGVPVLLTREKTERPEAVEAGTVRLVGTDPACIVSVGGRLLSEESFHRGMATRRNPFGDGQASRRIVDALEWHWGHRSEAVEAFSPDGLEKS